MTTFGYAYHSDSAEILKGRAAFKEINRIMRGLDGKAFETANTLVRKEYAATQSYPLAEMLLARQSAASVIGYPYNSPPFQAQIEAQRRWAERANNANVGLLGGAFGGLL